MVQVIYPLAIAIHILFGYSSEFELNSEESTLPKRLHATIPFGKRLKLSVSTIHYSTFLWTFNNSSVSEKCETEMTPTGSDLICSDMHWSDEGLYECHGITSSGQREILLPVDVKVVECTEQQLAAKQRIELRPSAYQENVKCFCSGITDRCSMADDLFRSKITVNVTERDMVDLRITKTTVRESWSKDHESELATYYLLPTEMQGNLLKSYGGYMEFPSTDDEIDKDKPNLVLQSKHRTLVYFDRREQVESGELNRSRVHMTEQKWRQLNNKTVSRDTFLTVLSNVTQFYVKYNQFRSFEPIRIVLDSADYEDHGLGRVTTVEKCECRSGYTGLSCEYCSRGFYRRPAILEQGICVSKREFMASAWRNRWDEMRNNYL